MDKGLTVAVGAEGCTEIQNPDGTYLDWVREATEEEAAAWRAAQKAVPIRLIDDMGRPYFLLTVLENAPWQAKNRAEDYNRVKRLLDY